MFFYSILIFLSIIKYFYLELLNDFPRWYSKSKPEKISQYKSILDYLRIGNCQSIKNNCNELPTYPNKRAYHTSVFYRTYSQKEANELCPSNYCGPFCNYTSDNCLSNNIYQNFPTPTILELQHYNPPSNDDCPNNCCKENDEYCYRLINNCGNEILPDHDIILIFGGLTLNKVKFELDNIEKNVLLNCEEIISGLEQMTSEVLISDENINLLYLINNCGYEMTNELWEYNIQKDSWKYLKPYIDNNNLSQQKPYPRYGHSSVYIEILDNNTNFIRKYLFIYGGFSIYCQHSCEDMWYYEISYGPQRFYPNISSIEWERGNKWKEIFPWNNYSPGKRALHSMTVDSKFKYIYLFGGYSIDENQKNTLMDDLWRYNIQTKTWNKINTNGIYLITRAITYWDGSSTIINISPKDFKQTTVRIFTILKDDNINHSNIGNFPTKRSSTTLTYNKRYDDSEYLLLFGGLTYNTSGTHNIQYLLNDIWVYNITNNLWLEIFPKGDNPSSRYGHQILPLEEDLFILYGGISSNIFNNDLWLFKYWQNIWIQVNKEKINLFPETSNIEKWPYPTGYFSMSKFNEGIIINGGLIWKQKNVEYISYENYRDEEEPLLQSYLFNTLENLYLIYFNNCGNNCNENGKCHYGFCVCDENFWGDICKNKLCPKSLNFFEDDFHIKQECIYCSGNGQCLENGKCLCDEGFTGDDCSIAECLNNCSGEQYGKCVIKKPVSQCECNQELKRGGDDCSLIFCLNNCGDQGICNRNIGECVCPKNYYGIDCSVFIVNFRDENNYININKIVYILIFLYLLFN